MNLRDCPHCRGSGNEPYHNPHTKEIEYGDNQLCQNCDVCLGYGKIPEDFNSMQVRRLEILEGLPDKVFDHLLLLAYQGAVQAINSDIVVEWAEESKYSVFDLKKVNDGDIDKCLVSHQSSELLAWKAVFEILNHE